MALIGITARSRRIWERPGTFSAGYNRLEHDREGFIALSRYKAFTIMNKAEEWRCQVPVTL
jgi:hypothetical protein